MSWSQMLFSDAQGHADTRFQCAHVCPGVGRVLPIHEVGKLCWSAQSLGAAHITHGVSVKHDHSTEIRSLAFPRIDSHPFTFPIRYEIFSILYLCVSFYFYSFHSSHYVRQCFNCS